MLRKLSTNFFHPQLPIKLVNGQHATNKANSKIMQYQWIHLHGQMANTVEDSRGKIYNLEHKRNKITIPVPVATVS